MKGASKVIMGATLVMVVSLAIVLGLVLVLLAELYCTLLLRRRQLKLNSSNSTAAASTAINPTITTTSSPANTYSPHLYNQSASPPTRYYAPGVLQAPRNLFFPSVSSCIENKAAEIKKQINSQFHHIVEVHTQESNTSPSSPPASLIMSPHQIREIPIQSSNANEKACVVGDRDQSFVYISNPIYDNDGIRGNRVETPFETPDSSPSRLETGGSGSDEEEIAKPSPSSTHTPPLTPMKKLPAEACSVSLRDARSLGTSGSDSVSNNGLSSSSSGSPCTSPSW